MDAEVLGNGLDGDDLYDAAVGTALVGVIGTLLGAVIGGGITLAVERERHRYEKQTFFKRDLLVALVDALAFVNAFDIDPAAPKGVESAKATTLRARLVVLGASDELVHQFTMWIIESGRIVDEGKEFLKAGHLMAFATGEAYGNRMSTLYKLALDFSRMARQELAR